MEPTYVGSRFWLPWLSRRKGGPASRPCYRPNATLGRFRQPPCCCLATAVMASFSGTIVMALRTVIGDASGGDTTTSLVPPKGILEGAPSATVAISVVVDPVRGRDVIIPGSGRPHGSDVGYL
jgi:hypothetical protein